MRPTLISQFRRVMGKAVTKKYAIEPFVHKHASTYGLRIMELCPRTSRVVSVHCQFCVYFGFDDDPTKPPRKRGHKTTNMTWTSFRSDNYRHHHDTQHALKWHEYQACSFEEKSHFVRHILCANTMRAHINTAVPFKFIIQLSIVDTLIGDMFFHPDDQGGITHVNALKLVKHFDSKDETDGEHYEAPISNPEQFRLVVAILLAECLFGNVAITTMMSSRFLVSHSRLCVRLLIQTGVS